MCELNRNLSCACDHYRLHGSTLYRLRKLSAGSFMACPLETPKLSMSVAGGSGHTYPQTRACRRGDRMMGRSSLAAGADRHLSGGAVRWFDARPLRPARPDCAKHMDDTAERHHTEECQRT